MFNILSNCIATVVSAQYLVDSFFLTLSVDGHKERVEEPAGISY